MNGWADLENRQPSEVRERHIAFRAKIAEKAVDDTGISCLSASLRSPIAKPVINEIPKIEPEPIAKPWFWIVDEIRGTPSIHTIRRIVAKHHHVSVNDLISARRDLQVILPRQIAMYLAKILTAHSLPQIGRHFGDRDHTTVLHAVRKMASRVAAEPEFAAEIEKLKAEIV